MPETDASAALISDIEKIKKRNVRVETDKAWETSKTRRTIITVSIYALSVFVLWSIKAPDPAVNALVPALGFLLSTATFPIFKAFWAKFVYQIGQKDRGGF